MRQVIPNIDDTFTEEGGPGTVAAEVLSISAAAFTIINTKTLQFNKYCKGLPVKASKQQKSFWG